MTTVPIPPAPVHRKCVEALPPTRSCQHRGIEWDREAHELTVTCGKNSERYAVSEIYPGRGFAAGRAFEVVKLSTGEAYGAFLAHDRAYSSCDCAGKTYEGTARADRRHGERGESLGCKHLDALAALADNGWLPDPRANPDADAGPTERHDQPEPDGLPACFDGCGSAESPDVPF